MHFHAKLISMPRPQQPPPPDVVRRVSVALRQLGGGASSGSSKARQPAANLCSAHDQSDIEDLLKPGNGGHQPASPLFRPDTLKDVQKPLLEASTLPAECYYSSEWYDAEIARVFANSWTLVGREDEISAVGSYLTKETEWGGPVVVCRGEDMQIYAFANVCRHRGAQVVQDSHGQCSKIGFVCPYHAWTYDFNGKLKWAPGMDDVEGFDESVIQLAPVRVEFFHGFVFICSNDDAPSLEQNMGDLPQKLPEWYVQVCSFRRVLTALAMQVWPRRENEQYGMCRAEELSRKVQLEVPDGEYV